MTSSQPRKVVIVGAGAVGATYAYALAQSGLADEIVLIDQNEQLVRGQVLDLVHGQPFFHAVAIREGDSTDYRDAQLIVITAGAAQKPGETRLQLLQKNAAIMRSIVSDIVAHNAEGLMLIVSNPVDVMTHVAIEQAGGNRQRVFGSGTVLDSARLRHFLSKHCGVDVHNIHAYILGEHGDSEFAAWSLAHIAGMPLAEFCPVCGGCEDPSVMRNTIEQQVRDSAYHIINYKGATNFAVGLALVRITKAVLRGENSVLTVSTRLDGEFGLNNVCLSVPCVVAGNGIEKIVECKLPPQEAAALTTSAATLQKAITQLAATPSSKQTI